MRKTKQILSVTLTASMLASLGSVVHAEPDPIGYRETGCVCLSEQSDISEGIYYEWERCWEQPSMSINMITREQYMGSSFDEGRRWYDYYHQATSLYIYNSQADAEGAFGDFPNVSNDEMPLDMITMVNIGGAMNLVRNLGRLPALGTIDLSQLSDVEYTYVDMSWDNTTDYCYLEDFPDVIKPTGYDPVITYEFRNNPHLTNITIPLAYTEGNDRVCIQRCPNLTTAAFEEGTTDINSAALSDNTALTEVTIPDSVTDIEYCAFYGCDSLTSVFIPASVKLIRPDAFNSCDNLTDIYFDCTRTEFLNDIYMIFTDEYGVTSYDHEFYGVDPELHFIPENSGVAVAEADGGYYSWICNESQPDTIVANMISSYDGHALSEIYRRHQYWHAYYAIGDVDTLIVNGNSDLGNYYDNVFDAVALQGLEGDYIENIEINGAVTEIHHLGRAGSNLQTIDVNDATGDLMLDMRNNSYTDLPELITGDYDHDLSLEFSGGSGFTELTVPQSYCAPNINWWLSGCPNLTSVEISSGAAQIPTNAFAFDTSLTNVTIPDTVTSIEYSAFVGCSSLTTLQIPSSVTLIRSDAFEDTGLTDIYFDCTIDHFMNDMSVYLNDSHQEGDETVIEQIYVHEFKDCDAVLHFLDGTIPATSDITDTPTPAATSPAVTEPSDTDTPSSSTPEPSAEEPSSGEPAPSTPAPSSSQPSAATPAPSGSDLPESPLSGGRTASGFVDRLYNVALGREADPTGHDEWLDELTSGRITGAEAARGFLLSPEFTNRNYSDEEFIDILYNTFFGRDADPEGKANWLAVLAGGTSREDIIGGFVDSTEWANLCVTYGIRSGGTGVPNINVEPNELTIQFVQRLYTICLGREADEAGLMAWASALSNQRETGSGAARGFLFSQEFIGKGYDNGEYVTRLYRAILGREPDEVGLAAWTAILDGGEQSREEVFDGFANSNEFGVICGQYGILR